MIKHPIGIKDLNNSYVHSMFNDVVAAFRELSLATGLSTDALILEEFGTTLVQNAWNDETGWFVTYRLHPLYSHMAKLVEASLRAQDRFRSIFGVKTMEVTREDEADPNTRITVHVKTGTHSIGD